MKGKSPQDLTMEYTTNAASGTADGGCSSDDQSVTKEPSDVVKGMVIGFKVRNGFLLFV